MSLVTKKPVPQTLDQESSRDERQIENLPADRDRPITWSGSIGECEPFIHRSELEEQILLAAGQTC
jgi:hypothetical protein